MGDKEGKSFLRKLGTVITSPIWVPVAAVGGLVSGPVRGLAEAADKADQRQGDGFDKAGEFIGQAPGSVLGKTVTGPFEAVKKMGDALWDDK